MKKISTLLLTVIIMIGACVGLIGCGKDKSENGQTYYVAAADFFYSNDKGHSYGNGTKEYQVGETVYMKVKAKATSNKEIPETESVAKGKLK